MMSLSGICVSDDAVRQTVKYWAFKLYRFKRKSIEFEDAEQIVWERVFNALPRYHNDIPINKFVNRVLFSACGSLIYDESTPRRIERTTKEITDIIDDVDYEDRLLSRIQVDRVEQLLFDAAKTNGSFRSYYAVFRYIKRGFSIKDASEAVGVSHRNVRVSAFRFRRYLKKRGNHESRIENRD